MDSYRVVGAGGKEYGPVDLPGLIKWVAEGRVTAATLIRKNDETPVAASALPELGATFAPVPPSTVPPIATSVALPTEWRSWDFIGTAWQLVRPHWLLFGVMFLVLKLLGGLAFGVIVGALMIGAYRAVLAVLAGRPPTFEMLFSGFDRFVPAFLATIVIGILTGIAYMACFVPGIILTLMWMFTLPVIAETDQDFWTAMKTSADLASGHWWDLFCLCLANMVVVLIGLLCCCVGVFVSEAVVFTSFALAYRFLQERQGRTA